VRDADRTKARIFEAAAEEFAARGFDGTRIDKIAERAGVNKRMIYFYWGDKQELYREILRQKVQAMHEIFTTEWGSPAENLVRYFTGTVAETELLRFIQWEALGDLGPSLVAEDDRRETFKLKVRALEHDQRQGNLTSDIPADLLMLIFMALSSYPVAFSQNVRLVTGLSSDDPRFQEQWSKALGVVAQLLGAKAADTDDAAADPAAEAIAEPAPATRPRSGGARRTAT
jgi:AcrR family transcriptional regulator